MNHVAIISHGHEDLLIASKLGGLLDERALLTIWVKDNLPKPDADAPNRLKDFCLEHGIFYTNEQAGLGFGHNNNFLFELIQRERGFGPQDIFLVMNPDITVSVATLSALVARMQRSKHAMATLNLYRDHTLQIKDSNIRHFPGVVSILKMPVVNSFSETYDKEQIEEFGLGVISVEVEWASGAFLAFTPEHYAALGGFDPHYFMYFEDVDICYRSRKYLKRAVHFYPDLKAVHTAAHKNRNIASQHARWFFQSFFKFLMRRYFLFRQPYLGSTNALTKTDV